MSSALSYPANVFRMKSIHVLERVHSVENRGLVHLARQRKLDQDPVDVDRGVEFVDQFDQLGGRGVLWQGMQLALDADAPARALLVTNVNFASRVVADQNSGQTWVK